MAIDEGGDAGLLQRPKKKYLSTDNERRRQTARELFGRVEERRGWAQTS